MSGIMSVTGEPDGLPQKMGVAFSDLFTALYGVIGIQAALAERDQSGQGQHIDMSLYDSMVAVMANQTSNHLIGGVTPTRLGNAHPNIVPYQVFACADGHIIVAVGNDRQFERLCTLLNRSDLAADPSYSTNSARVTHRDTLIPMLAEQIATWQKTDLLTAMEQAVVPSAPINTLADVFVDPQITARGMQINPGGIPGVRSPLVFSESTLDLSRRSPNLGEHTKDILSELGL